MVSLDTRRTVMFEGTLIAESMRPGTVLDAVPMTVRRTARYAVGSATEDQPGIWTSIDFEIADSDAGPLADALAAVLGEPGWYANFQSATEAYVVFAGQVFRYPRGDPAGRSQAREHGRRLGVPEAQLDWTV
jgi:hypothetical protein